MSECTHNCETCGADCASRTAESLLAPQNELSDVKKVIAVVSGKGGVGKSLVTALMANAARNKGKTAAILDADVTGPSVPKLFGIRERAQGTENSLFPVQTSTGIRVMSVNLLLENETDPVVWRGPVIAGVIKQFWSDVIWDKVDYMFVDMPPGTGDVPLTVFQSLPVEGIIMVTSPQDLVAMIVSKAVNMAKQMDIPVLGIVENMSYFECPDNGKRYNIFGESHIDEVAYAQGIKVLAKLPIDPKVAELVDNGRAAELDVTPLEDAVRLITAVSAFKKD
ncbi:MAG TPA: ATP-binding protein [Ruminococcaceae bacterium]|nr:ATP-binding protein [Oscillospiraceae bacterium]